ncbi:RNA polymerase sigma factor [Aureibacter tunicatorum]
MIKREGKKINDQQLVKSYIKGNEAAFGLLYEKYSKRVFMKILNVVKDSEVAEDLAQETFVKVSDTLNSGNYNEEGKFQPWLMRIAHNKAIDWYRKYSKYTMVTDDENPNLFKSDQFVVNNAEDTKVQEELVSKLLDLIEGLPETQKEVLKMRSFMGMSFQEIADETGVSINTALGRMRYAIINLRKNMDQSDAMAMAYVA